MPKLFEYETVSPIASRARNKNVNLRPVGAEIIIRKSYHCKVVQAKLFHAFLSRSLNALAITIDSHLVYYAFITALGVIELWRLGESFLNLERVITVGHPAQEKS